MQRSGEKEPWRLVERFDCDIHCSDAGTWVDGRRSERGCTRDDLPPVPWHVNAQAIRREGYMGRNRLAPGTVLEDGMQVRWKQPLERATDGCPGGWYRSRFVASLIPFMRMRVQGGQRVSNPLFDRCDDELVIALVLYHEIEQERWEGQKEETISHG